MSFLNWLKNVVLGQSGIVDDSPKLAIPTALPASAVGFPTTWGTADDASISLDLPVQSKPRLRVSDCLDGIQVQWENNTRFSAIVHSTFISAADLRRVLRAGFRLPYDANSVVVSFDDGSEGTIRSLLPLLASDGVVNVNEGEGIVRLCDDVELL